MIDWHHLLSEDFVMHLFTRYGYSVIFITVTLESMGLPLPAESLLAASALLCATTHHLYVGYIALCGITGAIIGDNIGFFFGEYIGLPFIEKYGPRFGLTQTRQAVARYIFKEHGGSVVFVGRFISFLRMFVSMIAGAGGMPHKTFLFFNVLSAFVWGTLYTLIPFYLGGRIEHMTYGLAIGAVVAVIFVIIGLYLLWRKKEADLTHKALSHSRHQAHLLPVVIPADKGTTKGKTERASSYEQKDSSDNSKDSSLK